MTLPETETAVHKIPHLGECENCHTCSEHIPLLGHISGIISANNLSHQEDLKEIKERLTALEAKPQFSLLSLFKFW